MANPYLSVVIVNDNEKDAGLLRACLSSIEVLNADALEDGSVEFIVVDQSVGQMREATNAIRGEFSTRVPHGYSRRRQTCVNGAILWNLMEDMQFAWRMVHGRYVLMVHKEAVFGPGYLTRFPAWLRSRGEPLLALGNMVRLGTAAEMRADPAPNGEKRHTGRSSSSPRRSAELRDLLNEGDGQAVCEFLASTPTAEWDRLRPKTPEKGWYEDVFFARKDWIDQVMLWWHADDRLLFQDVYDLMRDVVMPDLAGIGAEPLVAHADRDKVGMIYHLYHERGYPHLTPEVAEFFQEHADAWHQTAFADKQLLRECDKFLSAGGKSGINPLGRLKRGKWGTVSRYRRAFTEFIQDRANREALQLWTAKQQRPMTLGSP
jgi:hypothetical protein